MKKLLFIGMLCYALASCNAQNETLLPNYNSSYYPTVLQATEGVGMPFLLQEQYKTMPGVTVKQDSFLVYKGGKPYAIHNFYLNPNAQFNNGYYIALANYNAYDLPAATASVWPQRIPYTLYDKSTRTFNSTVDCVGFGTHMLSATGSTDSAHNAYLQLANYVYHQKVTPFAALGYVAQAYQIAAAFPTLPASVTHGWQYVAGNVNSHVIDSLNHTGARKGLGTYTGTFKSGVANALPGDVLSFGYAPGHGANGHFMVIEQAPILLTATTLLAYYGGPAQPQVAPLIQNLLINNNVYAVPLYDCSGKNVHFNDSRKYMSGIGHGTILLIADKATDTPQGFIFSPPSKPVIGAKLMGDSVLAITVGRYIP